MLYLSPRLMVSSITLSPLIYYLSHVFLFLFFSFISVCFFFVVFSRLLVLSKSGEFYILVVACFLVACIALKVFLFATLLKGI